MHAANDTVKLALFHMRKVKRGGRIVMTASLAGYLASAGAPLYSAAKHGMASNAPSAHRAEKGPRLTLAARHRGPDEGTEE